jgi:hypothetical protein
MLEVCAVSSEKALDMNQRPANTAKRTKNLNGGLLNRRVLGEYAARAPQF